MLIICPECGGKLSDQAVSCPHCGYPLRKFTHEPESEPFASNELEYELEDKELPYDYHAGERPSLSAWGKAGSIIVALAVLVVSVFAINAYKTNAEIGKQTIIYATARPDNENSDTQEKFEAIYGSGSSTSKPKKYYTDEEIKSALYVYATDFVKEKLKSPSSAKFPVMSKCEFEKGKDDVYMMVGDVEAENGFGGTRNETWGVMVSIKDGTIHFIYGKIGDEEYFS